MKMSDDYLAKLHRHVGRGLSTAECCALLNEVYRARASEARLQEATSALLPEWAARVKAVEDERDRLRTEVDALRPDAEAWRAVVATERGGDGERLGKVAHAIYFHEYCWERIDHDEQQEWRDVALAVRRAVIAQAVTDGSCDAAVDWIKHKVPPHARRGYMRGAILAAHGAPAVDAILDQLRPENAALLLDDERSRRKVADRDRDAEIARADAADAECKRLQSVVDLYVGRQDAYEAWLLERDAQSAELESLRRDAEEISSTVGFYEEGEDQPAEANTSLPDRVRSILGHLHKTRFETRVAPLLDEVRRPASVPVGAPGSAMRAAWELGRELADLRRVAKAADAVIGSYTCRDRANDVSTEEWNALLNAVRAWRNAKPAADAKHEGGLKPGTYVHMDADGRVTLKEAKPDSHRIDHDAVDAKPDWHRVSDDTAFALPFGTVRQCIDCGALVGGGPARCVWCAKEAKPDVTATPGATMQLGGNLSIEGGSMHNPDTFAGLRGRVGPVAASLLPQAPPLADADPCPVSAHVLGCWKDGKELNPHDGDDPRWQLKSIAWLYRENNRRKEALAHAESAVSEIVKLQAAMVEREAELTARVEKLEKGGAK